MDPSHSRTTPSRHFPLPMSSAAASPGTSSSSTPLVAQGDWIKNLVHLAKTAELKCVFVLVYSSPPES